MRAQRVIRCAFFIIFISQSEKSFCAMEEFIDQINRKVVLNVPPKRIVSLVPSQTELLADLELNDKVIGVTKYCIYPPEWLLSKSHVGGTKNFSIEKISTLNPDLIIANKEENTQPLIEELAKNYPVWISDITNLEDSLEMILEVGKMTNTIENAQKIVSSINYQFLQLEQEQKQKIKLNAAYFIWRKPYMVAGSNTFVNDMLHRCGLTNVFAHLQRYPEVTDHDLREAKPDVILLSSEPFPFREKHIEEFKMICPWAKVLTINGEFFSWYGSRLKMAPNYFTQVLQELYSKDY